MTLVDAKWIGPWGHRLPDGTELIPGETVRQVPLFQAQDDNYWEPVGKISTPTKAPKGGDK